MKLTHLAAMVAAVSMMAPMAHASKSRLGALEVGGVYGTDGSLFIKDTRNIFINPAYVSQFGKNVNLELGADTNAGTTTEPRSEGGFIVAGDGMAYGVQLGRSGIVTQTHSSLASGLGSSVTTNSQDMLFAQDSIELFYGSGAWGVSVHYASSTDDNPVNADTNPAGDGDDDNNIDQSAQAATVKFGYNADKFEVFAHVDVMGTATSDGQDAGAAEETINGALGVRVGGTFMLDDMSSVGATVRTSSIEVKSDDGTTENTADWSTTRVRVEYFRNMVKEENSMAYYKVGLNYEATETKLDVGGDSTLKDNTTSLPVTVGLETKGTDWMTFRGSITQNVILHTVEDDNDSDKRVTNNESSTMVAGGIGLTFGGLTIDGMLSAGTVGTTQGNLDGNNLLTRIGANYSF